VPGGAGLQVAQYHQFHHLHERAGGANTQHALAWNSANSLEIFVGNDSGYGARSMASARAEACAHRAMPHTFKI